MAVRSLHRRIVDAVVRLMVNKMRAIIVSAQSHYQGPKFIGLTADCWTSRSMHGYVAIEASFIYFDPSTSQYSFCRMTLGCVYCPGSHNGAAIAILIRKIFEKIGIRVLDIRMYTSDSGGGIPAAARYLGTPRDACGLHSMDTAVGHATGQKGVRPTPGAAAFKVLVAKVCAQAYVFKNATQKRGELFKIGETIRANAEAFKADVQLPNSKIVQLPGNTRMWSTATTFGQTAEQDPYLDAYFSQHDPLNEHRLTPTQRNEVQYSAPVLRIIAGIQKIGKLGCL
jgi:hypothetical protein